MFKKQELKLLWPFYLSALLPQLISAYAIVYLVVIGLSYTQIAILMAVNCFIHVLFDIPTGAIADILGRKASVLISLTCSGILFILVPLSTNFYYLLILFVIWGVTQTLATGADEAWVVSLLQNNKKSKLIKAFYAKSASIANIGVVVGPLLAALIVTKIGISYVWTFQGILTIIAVVILLFAKEHFKKSKHSMKKIFAKTLKQSKTSIKYGIKHPTISKMLLAMVFIGFFAAGTGLLWQPYLQTFNIPLEYFGYVLSITGVLAIFVPLLTAWLAEKFSRKSKYLSILLLVLLLVSLSIYFVNTILIAIIIVTLLFLAMQFIMPVELPFFQKFLPEKMRATIGSFKSTLEIFGAGIAILICGIIADLIGPKYTIASLGVFLVPAILLYFSIKTKAKKKPTKL